MPPGPPGARGRRAAGGRPIRRTHLSGGLRLGYIDWGGRGDGQMLLIHDLGDSPRTWDVLAAAFRASHRIIAPELRGHGGSDRPPTADYGFDSLYSDLRSLAGSVDLAGAMAIGHGAGARLAARLAAERPDMVSLLVIYDLEAREDHPEIGWASIDEMVGYLGRQRPGVAHSVLDRQARSLSGGGLDGGRAFRHDSAAHPAYMLAADQLWSDWSAITCPTLIIRGRMSRDLGHAEAVGISESIDRCRLAEIEDAGRWLHQQLPEAFGDTLRWFLDSQPP